VGKGHLSSILASGVLVGLAALLAAQAPGESPTQTIAFERHHRASMAIENGKRKQVPPMEYLKITKVSPASITFCLDTMASNSNMCNLSGKAAREETGAYIYRKGSAGKECVLELAEAAGGWTVMDKTGQCTRLSCGAGANIGKLTFLSGDRVAKVRPCESE
jgi:hypothetical protein